MIDALQRELLPAGVPVLPGLEVAGSYLLADAETAAGGDWFDAVVLADGRVALVVGDVVGHGLAASATMGQLRVLVRERLLSTWSPSPRIRIDGPVDAATAGAVERAVRAAGAVGTRDLTLDLAGVTHLASAGVAAFHRLSDVHQANGTALQLCAPTAGPADMILTLVQLDHVTRDPHTAPGHDAPADPDHG